MNLRQRYTIIGIVFILIFNIVLAVYGANQALRRRSMKKFLNATDLARYGNDTSTSRRVPRIIHQTNRNYDVPVVWNATVQAVMRQNLGEFKYRRWSHDDMDAFVREHEPEFHKQVFSKYLYDMQRIDSFRYVMMYHMGGVYIDMDSACYRRLNEFVNAIEAMDPESPYLALFPEEGFVGLQTDFLVGTPGHPIFKQFITRLPYFNHNYLIHHVTILLSAGPLYASVQEHFFKQTQQAVIRVLANQVYGSEFWKTNGGTWFGRDTLFILYVYYNHDMILRYCAIVMMIIFILVLIVLLVRKYPKYLEKTFITLQAKFYSLIKSSKLTTDHFERRRVIKKTYFSQS